MTKRNKDEQLPKNEHLLAIVEPTAGGGDTTLEAAHEAAARGADVTVVMMITDRVRRDIGGSAKSKNDDLAEGHALEHLLAQCRSRVGGSPTIITHFGPVRSDIVQYVTPKTTAIALPERLAEGKLVRLLTVYTGLPVLVTPTRAAQKVNRAESTDLGQDLDGPALLRRFKRRRQSLAA
ncbi:MAG: hypothetical protein HKN91_07915 [Acidimicrobiia bacterium]|nr:hypothetical protein [Acidimicrobiia bacterium]